MNTKHTPGPWTVAPSAKASTLTRIFQDDTGKLVASANGPGLSESGEAEANARLIAAAPDLLAALKGILDRMDDDSYNEPHYEAVNAFMNKARAAIAKATGQQ